MPPKRQVPTTTMGASLDHAQCQSADEFTRSVKRKLSSSTRTGQACDRCKVRKIRCDGLPEGCSPCLQNRTECRTTDRISQRAVPRGYVENLESKCHNLEAKVKEMEMTLERMAAERNGVSHIHPEILKEESGLRSNGTFIDWPHTNGAKPNPYGNRNGRLLYPQTRGSGVDKNSMRQSAFRAGSSSGDYYLGISSGCSSLTSMKASALSVLGIEIDLSDLDPSEPRGTGEGIDDSYASCLSSMLNVNSRAPTKLDLAPKQEGIILVSWFTKFSYPYLPIIHRPTFMKELEKMYDDKDYQPSPGMLCQVHMIFAIGLFHAATRELAVAHAQRNSSTLQAQQQPEICFPNGLQRSYEHYHYALTFFYNLLHSAGLEDLQALCLILQHLRSFPRPGGCWFLSRLATSMAVELGLHRSSKKWRHFGNGKNAIEEEMRKRVWWCLLTMEVSLGSKLGRPMSIREADYDTELPERIDDEYITPSGFLPIPENAEGCLFDVGIELFKVVPLYTEINSTLYAVSRPSRERYVELVEKLEGRLVQWKKQLPKWITPESPDIEHRFQAAHLECWFHECRILMRHPSLSLSPSPIFNRDSLKICVESSRTILYLTDKLRKDNNHLDTTWYAMTVQLLATLTILFSMWEKRDGEVTQEEIDQVKADMDLCQDIMGDIGVLLGSPNQLRDIVQRLTKGTMDMLYQKQGKAQGLNGNHSARPMHPGIPTTNGNNASPLQYPIHTTKTPEVYASISAPSHPNHKPGHNGLPNPHSLSPRTSSDRVSLNGRIQPPPTQYNYQQPQQMQPPYITEGFTVAESQYTESVPNNSSGLNGLQNTSHLHTSYQPTSYTQAPPAPRALSLDSLTHPHSHHPQHTHPVPSITHPSSHPIFHWGYSGNESWQKYAEYVSTIDFENTVGTGADLYSASALMTLSNNPLLNVTATASVEAVGGDRDGSLGTAGINVPPQRGGEAVPTTGVTVTLGPGAVSVVAAASQWSLMGGGYGYPNGTSTQGSAGTDEEGGR